ncbi:histidine phosphatase family protein [Prosthecobacter sp.]|uniref:SixA phosphatase family protein n=1 Tax=Prosthecobacter sp. TaxID=1965333 RepID=UPI002488C11C|nr:histidine phosphatase family protein [Prosthecobacter sp.]MDI1313354.1 histidine phosphatase family protein [Prosthecobacter sp.]
MKYLTIVRHAKSSWAEPGCMDHDRPLNERGKKATPAVATFLHRTYFAGNGTPALLPPPDRLITSTALRALTTAQMMLETLALPPEKLQLDSKLYLAEAGRILEVMRDFDESWRHVMIFGHNPGMHDFADRILARANIPKMPTCTAVIMAFPHEYWGLADWHEAQLIGYITPKALERRFPELYAGISREDGED